jgi:hypothetical protein
MLFVASVLGALEAVPGEARGSLDNAPQGAELSPETSQVLDRRYANFPEF